MFKWTYSESVTTEATPAQIWAMWQDVPSWPCWDNELKWARLNGDFTKGTTGRLKPVNGPAVDFTLSRVEIHCAFSNVATLPLTNLVFDHDYFSSAVTGEPAYIRHSVTMTGWLVPVFSRLIGNRIKAHLRDAMIELNSICVRK
ncbi:hypothetical protein [Yersinia intermedia]|uniref:hypothetical protein n=1 Tax=Yersinia intermedia TaxID=631 RepID=UPI0005E0C2CD|nr:hypothetical protein [Yersinia intermedia]CND47414.1 Uncharacterised protein [Yersinia intermedia]